MVEVVNLVAGWFPRFDGQTLFSLVVGLAVSIVTFAWAYKNTIGVREERLRVVNAELAASVLRRVAVERMLLTGQQFDALVRTKAYRASVPQNRVSSFNSVLDAVVTDTIDNVFLDNNAKEEILVLAGQSRTTDSLEPLNQKSSSEERFSFILGVAAAIAGLISATFTGDIWTKISRDDFDKLFPMAALVVVVLLLCVVTLSFVRKMKRTYRPPDYFEDDFMNAFAKLESRKFKI